MKFYHYRQNNSYGRFDRDENVASNVIIEAENANTANNKAENIGIYFHGCEEGRDCPCCGDRWSKVDEYDADDAPKIYGDPVEAGDNAIVYYNDGRKEDFRTKQ